MVFVVLPTTMSRILKQHSGLHRIERGAALTGSQAADRWLQGVVEGVMRLATEKEEKTISEATVGFVTQQADVTIRPRAFCKTRLRDRVKALSGGFRWALAAKIVLYNAFDDY
jgi:hypothetical protein